MASKLETLRRSLDCQMERCQIQETIQPQLSQNLRPNMLSPVHLTSEWWSQASPHTSWLKPPACLQQHQEPAFPSIQPGWEDRREGTEKGREDPAEKVNGSKWLGSTGQEFPSVTGIPSWHREDARELWIYADSKELKSSLSFIPLGQGHHCMAPC